VAVLSKEKRQQLEKLLEADLAGSLGKLKVDEPQRGTGAGTGVGTGAGTRTGPAGTGTGKAPPTREVKVDVSQKPTGSLGERTSDEIHRAIAARAGTFRACYQRELDRTPGISGKLVVKFTIKPDGSVTGVVADPAATTLNSQAVSECIRANITRLKFPARDNPSEVTYPFRFSADP
jgi:outer membrane biosynthesis protein TonB